MALRFRRADRMTRRSDFVRVLRAGAAAREGGLLVRLAPNGLGRMRLGLRVPRAYGSAAERNRAKRVLREAFRLWRAEPAPGEGLDLVVSPLPGAAPEIETWKRSLERCAARAADRLGGGR